MSKLLALFLVCCAMTFGVTATPAQAGLLGVETVRPFVAFNSTGVLNYNASSRQLTATATLIAVRFNGIELFLPLGSAQMALNVQLRTNGSFYRGVQGHDLVLNGTIDVNDDGIPEYTGILLTAEVRAVGFLDNGETDVFDFRLETTGGSMAGVFGKEIAIILTSEHSSFVGNFCLNFGGGAKGDIGTKSGGDECPRTPGWWEDNRCNWPVSHVNVGGQDYNACEIDNVLDGDLPNGRNSYGNVAARLAKYVIATKFNLLNGAGDPGGLIAILAEADAFLAAHPPGSSLTQAQIDEANAYKDALYDFVTSRPNGCGGCGGGHGGGSGHGGGHDRDDCDERRRRRGC
ncbi:MAG: hypothetical protein H7210_14870 [Pyrinomonadaceae bacterium]|nr:hypothetical protein [Phycisphaerales bacterium]